VDPPDDTQGLDRDRLRQDYFARLVEAYRPLLEMDRRRREAAWRLAPMPDGRRDPIGPIMDGRWP
jgi:hypothetical protein